MYLWYKIEFQFEWMSPKCDSNKVRNQLRKRQGRSDRLFVAVANLLFRWRFVEEIIVCFDDSVNLSHTKFLPVFSKVDEILNIVTMTIGRRYNVFHG